MTYIGIVLPNPKYASIKAPNTISSGAKYTKAYIVARGRTSHGVRNSDDRNINAPKKILFVIVPSKWPWTWQSSY